MITKHQITALRQTYARLAERTPLATKAVDQQLATVGPWQSHSTHSFTTTPASTCWEACRTSPCGRQASLSTRSRRCFRATLTWPRALQPACMHSSNTLQQALQQTLVGRRAGRVNRAGRPLRGRDQGTAAEQPRAGLKPPHLHEVAPLATPRRRGLLAQRCFILGRRRQPQSLPNAATAGLAELEGKCRGAIQAATGRVLETESECNACWAACCTRSGAGPDR